MQTELEDEGGEEIPQNDLTNNRPKNYSKWHRFPNLPKWCYQTDGDFFEQRMKNNDLTVVAYVETIQIQDGAGPADYPIWNSKKALAKEINKKMNIPCYYVWHTNNCKIFFVNNINNDNVIKMFEEEYKRFIESL